MSDLPLVSIVTPSYNQGRFIEETILSVLNQDYPNIEYLIIDGGSTDGTLDILRKYEDQLIWVSEPDKGQSDAVNKGWRLARGEFLSWLNSDDVATPLAVRNSVRILQSNPDIVMTFGANIEIDADGREIGVWELREFDYHQLAGHPDWVAPPMMMSRRSVLERLGMLDTSLHYAMDYDLFVRLSRHGKVHYLPVYLHRFRRHSTAKSVIGWDAHKREILLVNKRYGSVQRGRLLRQYWSTRIRRFTNSILPVRTRRFLQRLFNSLTSVFPHNSY